MTFLKWEEEKRVGETGKDIRCIELISFLLLYLSTTSFYLKREVAKSGSSLDRKKTPLKYWQRPFLHCKVIVGKNKKKKNFD